MVDRLRVGLLVLGENVVLLPTEECCLRHGFPVYCLNFIDK